MATAADMLAWAESAIQQVTVLGQSVTLPGGTVVSRANLQVLIAWRDKLKGEVEPTNSALTPRFVPVGLGRLNG